MKNTEAVTKLNGKKLEAMFAICKAFNVNVISEGINISDCTLCEMGIKKVNATYYEQPIREAFHKYIKMYASVMNGEFKVL